MRLIHLNEITEMYVSVQIVDGKKTTVPQLVWINPEKIMCVRDSDVGSLIYFNDREADILHVMEGGHTIARLLADGP